MSSPAASPFDQLKFLEDDYFTGINFTRESLVVKIANLVIMIGEMISTFVTIPFVLVLALFHGLARGFMPLFVLWCNSWRMLMRPFLKLISEFFWSMTYNYSIHHHKRPYAEAAAGEFMPLHSPPSKGYESMV